MITNTDIKKMKAVFVTRGEFKKELKALDSKMDAGFKELLNFIFETKNDIMKELNDFRSEIRDIHRNYQATLNNHESRITHLEYINKP